MALINKDGEVTRVVKRQETFALDARPSKRWRIMYSMSPTSGWVVYRDTSGGVWGVPVEPYPSFKQAWTKCQELSSKYTETDWTVEPVPEEPDPFTPQYALNEPYSIELNQTPVLTLDTVASVPEPYVSYTFTYKVPLWPAGNHLPVSSSEEKAK